MKENYAQRSYDIKRIWHKILFHVASNMPFIKAEVRARIHAMAGVKIVNPASTFIGQYVYFDDLYPEDISVGEGTIITSGCKILAHFIDPRWGDYNHMRRGKVNIGRYVFIGMNTVIVKPISIGDYSVIGANSVLTKDVPPYSIVAGNPAKIIKQREIIYTSETD